MTDNSNGRNQGSTPERRVFVKQLSADIEVISLSHNASHQRKRKSEDGQEAAIHHDHHLQVDQSHPSKKFKT